MKFCLATLALAAGGADACSNLLISPGASTDESAMITYNADDAGLYGGLYHYPARENIPEGTMRDVWEWDTGKYMGAIPEAEATYNVVGNMNEHGLAIAETTAGGLEQLQSQEGAIMDYGSLIWTTLQRAKDAREAIHVAADLMDRYGYASGGESFSIADGEEVWLMEIVGKGDGQRGAIWVARKIPDGYVSGHANQMRITTFPQDDPENTLYAEDVISFAREIGAYPEDAADEDFSFSDVYDPVSFEGARFCEARVWSFFSNITSPEFAAQYVDYAQGYNLTNRMPLWVKPETGKISALDAMRHMRNHYEDSALSMQEDVGAGAFQLPYRWRGLTWDYQGKSYFNERAIGTQQTGWNFVAQLRRWLPTEVGSLLWFGADDSGTTVRFPAYAVSTRVPEAYGSGSDGGQFGVTPPVMQFSMESAHHVFNLVANWVYTRWDQAYPDLLERIEAVETRFASEVTEIDQEAQTILREKGREACVEFLTQKTVDNGNGLVKEWANLFGELFVRYRDGYTFLNTPEETSCGCDATSEGYGDEWYGRIVDDTGDHYLVPSEEAALEGRVHSLPSVNKMTLRAFK